jgi:hypothetical protein
VPYEERKTLNKLGDKKEIRLSQDENFVSNKVTKTTNKLGATSPIAED